MGGRKINFLLAGTAAQIRMHHVALNRARPHNGDFDDQIVEVTRLKARQHIHLRAALYLEHANRVGAAEHVVYGRVVSRHGAECERPVVVLFQKREGLANAGEHAKAQHIDF